MLEVLVLCVLAVACLLVLYLLIRSKYYQASRENAKDKEIICMLLQNIEEYQKRVNELEGKLNETIQDKQD